MVGRRGLWTWTVGCGVWAVRASPTTRVTSRHGDRKERSGPTVYATRQDYWSPPATPSGLCATSGDFCIKPGKVTPLCEVCMKHGKVTHYVRFVWNMVK